MARAPSKRPGRLYLHFKGRRLGEVLDAEGDFPWMHGKFVAGEEAAALREFFDWMTNEDKYEQEPPFDAELLNDEHWSLVSESGRARGISVPAVHADGLIAWRWR